MTGRLNFFGDKPRKIEVTGDDESAVNIPVHFQDSAKPAPTGKKNAEQTLQSWLDHFGGHPHLN